jgi:RHS repeat-associated protein
MTINLLYADKTLYIAVAEASATNTGSYTNLLYSANMGTGTYMFSFVPTQSNVELKIDYPYFNTKPMLCFTLDSVNYKQQTGNGTSTQLVQISNKLKGGYRFGYNGQEKVDEIAGAGNSYTTEWRQYDPRLGRWLSPDPLVSKFPGWSPYVFAFDNPIWFNDPDGDAPPTIKQIIAEGKKTSATFSSLLNKAKITDANFSQNISFGSGTYTEMNKEAKIVLTKVDDIKFQVIKLTHELTNRSKMATTIKLLDNAKEGTITPKEYAKKLAQTEVDGEINQIKVAAETGYRYKGKGMEGLNKLIDDYSKDKTIDLTKKVLPSAEHLKTYEQDAKDARADYIKINGDNKKE